MKIAILTLPLHANYGGILQCYALQIILRRMGHEVFLLERARFGRLYPFIKAWENCKYFFKHCFSYKEISQFIIPEKIVTLRIDRFIHRYIVRFYKRIWTLDVLRQFDMFIVGSDQIWRTEYFYPIEDAFLAFTRNLHVKRVAYAASFGVEQCNYSTEQLAICSALLKNFNHVSVREKSGVKICRDYFGVEAEQMIDPTLLLEADDYRKLLYSCKARTSKKYLLVYILDETEEKRKIVEQIAKSRDLVPYWLSNDKNKFSSGGIKMSVEQWLRAFDESEFVFTDSFHGCIFSILFKKSFVVMGNENRGITRFTSLLNLFSETERLVFSYEEYTYAVFTTDYYSIFYR